MAKIATSKVVYLSTSLVMFVMFLVLTTTQWDALPTLAGSLGLLIRASFLMVTILFAIASALTLYHLYLDAKR